MLDLINQVGKHILLQLLTIDIIQIKLVQNNYFYFKLTSHSFVQRVIISNNSLCNKLNFYSDLMPVSQCEVQKEQHNLNQSQSNYQQNFFEIVYYINQRTDHNFIYITSITNNNQYIVLHFQQGKNSKPMQNLNSSFHVYNCINSFYIHALSDKFENGLFQRTVSQEKVQQNSSNNQTQNIIQSIDEEKQVKIQEQTQNTCKNSVFHNYLKHLITTFKQYITIEVLQKYALEMGYDSQLSTKIWKQFIKSKKFSKKMLIMIVGSTNNNYKIQNKINQFLNSSKKYSRAQVNRSQQLFRKIIIEKFHGDKLEQTLKNRKIQSLEQFKIYFKCFIEELATKCVNKRLTKQKKQKILRPSPFQK